MSQLILFAILIPVLPLGAYLVQCAVGSRLPRMGDWVSLGAIFASFVLATQIFTAMWGASDPHWLVQKSWTWITVGSGENLFKFDVGVRLDNISAIMLLMVTLCATLIHLFSTGYMRDHHGHPEDGYRYASFFSYLSLFTAAMLGLIISDNLLTLFMSWEVMGLCSYLLIGFYRHKPSAANASLKAFMTTRVGDSGLFIALMAIFLIVKSFQFDAIYAAHAEGKFSVELFGMSAAFVCGLGVFLGTVGKSAQFPLQIWLPDAMEGPTPVSALIHAATMVAAGVYLILRMFPLLDLGGVLPIVAAVGGFTALFAAILAIKQNDIKKVLAYSTLSQLGYMVLAVGVGAFTAGFMHLITHAVFKACLFLSSGSVIYAMHHEQDMRHMGGLRKKIPITFWSMFIATLAISGVPFFSGFVSKDKILAGVLGYAMHHGGISWLLVISGFLTAGLTAFYMFRLIFMTFFGHPHDHHHYDEAHEGGFNLWLPLVILATLSISFFYTMGGGEDGWFVNLVHAPELENLKESLEQFHEFGHAGHMPAMIASIIVASLGIFCSWLVFIAKKPSADSLEAIWPKWVHKLIDNLYFFDWFYIKVVIQKIFLPISAFFAKFDDRVIDQGIVDNVGKATMLAQQASGAFDNDVIDGFLVDGVGGGVPTLFGSTLRILQNGKVQRYLTVAVGTIILILVLRGVL